MKISKRFLWRMITTGVAMVAGAVATTAVRYSWEKISNEDPPDDVGSPKTNLSDAILWTVITGLSVAVVQLFATRGITSGWIKATGETPPSGA